MTAGVLAACLAASAAQASEKSVVREDITIRGKAAQGPAVPPPPVKPERPIVDEVIRSLGIYKDDIRVEPSKARVESGPRRLSRPFPEPPYLVFDPAAFTESYARWSFEVFAGERSLRRSEGSGPVGGRLAWDGTDSRGRFIARVGEAYRWRFTAVQTGGEELSMASEPIEIQSVLYRENLGGFRMEVGNPLLFPEGKAALLASGAPYLEEMAARLRRVNPRRKPYRLMLFQEEPASELALARARNLRTYFSKALLVNPSKVEVAILPPAGRGDVTACALPPEEGARIREP